MEAIAFLFLSRIGLVFIVVMLIVNYLCVKFYISMQRKALIKKIESTYNQSTIDSSWRSVQRNMKYIKKITFWQGKYAMVKNENNKLRRENEKNKVWQARITELVDTSINSEKKLYARIRELEKNQVKVPTVSEIVV